MWQMDGAKVSALTWGDLATVILERLKRYTMGWLGYYCLAEMKARLKSLNEWLRRRSRQIFWKQWKKPSARWENLKRLGIEKGKAGEWANPRLGYWRVAGSWILSRSLTNEYLSSIGYDSVNRTVRTVV